jgi:hypothetical protein
MLLHWKSEKIRLLGHSPKRWMDVVEKDLENLGVQIWKEVI